MSLHIRPTKGMLVVLHKSQLFNYEAKWPYCVAKGKMEMQEENTKNSIANGLQ